MATSQEIITDAYRLLGAIDMLEEPSSAEMALGTRVLGYLFDSWSAQSLNVTSVTLTCNFDSGATTLSNFTDTTQLAIGLNVSGTGIVSGTRVTGIDNTAKRITIDTATTSSGSGASLNFDALPFQPRYERGVIAMLAVDLAPYMRMTPSKQVVDMAKDGWSNLTANFMRTPDVVFDKEIMFTSIRRDSGVITGNG